MRITQLIEMGELSLIMKFIPKKILDLIMDEMVMVFGAFAEEEEEKLTSLETGDEEMDGDQDELFLPQDRSIKAGDFLGFAVVLMDPAGAEVIWLYTIPEGRALGAASELLNEIAYYAFENSLDRIELLLPEKISFPKQKDGSRDKLDIKSFIQGCDFDYCNKYSYEDVKSSDGEMADILSRLPSKTGLRFTKMLLLKAMLI